MLLQCKTEGGVKWELDVVNGWLWIVLMERLIDTNGVWQFNWWQRLHVGGEVFLDEGDGEGVTVEDLFPVSHPIPSTYHEGRRRGLPVSTTHRT